ncbi:MAG: DUF192 domain-containing protein [Verrucomicrobia bacterium]|nr:DUF192 domain-containing protein [Verrucomicrobiota bacterium]
MLIRNTTRGTVIADRAEVARSVAARTRGLMLRRFDGFDGLVLEPCNSIHRCFMLMPLDVIFFDNRRAITKMVSALAPWRLFCGSWRAAGVLELPEGAIARSQSQPGDQLEFGGPAPSRAGTIG